MRELICYCFEYSAEDIREDVLLNDGRSLIMERIIAESRAGRCDCARLNPSGG